MSAAPATDQLALFGREEAPRFDPSFATLRRTWLDGAAWVDRAPGWVDAGHATLFQALERSVPWRRETRRMYDRTVAVPRLFAFTPDGAPAPHPVVDAMARALSDRYGVDFVHRSFALYRDGRDSVAFHRDRELRDRPWSLVAIVTLGGPRTFRLRPLDPARRGPTTSLGFRVGWGDLVVMGGDCQRTWEHGVPKAARAAPRLAVMFRHALDGPEVPGAPTAPASGRGSSAQPGVSSRVRP